MQSNRCDEVEKRYWGRRGQELGRGEERRKGIPAASNTVESYIKRKNPNISLVNIFFLHAYLKGKQTNAFVSIC
jgi:hypothetical protein